MAKQGGLGQFLYIGGYDLSGDIGAIQNAGSPRGTLDKTGLNSSAVERVMTHGGAHMEWRSHFNPSASREHPVLSALPTSDQQVTWGMGTTIGADVFCINGKQINYDGTREQQGDFTLSVAIEGSSVAVEWGELLTSGGKATHASATSESSLDGGAGTSAGLAAYLEFFSRASGTPTFVVEHSTNGSTWATLLTFSGTGGASPFSERKTVSGTVNRYLRATTNGTFTNAVFSVSVRRGTAQDDAAY